MDKNILGKREQKTFENRRAIIATCTRLFNEKGYNETTMNDICKESGLAYGSIYNLYPSKKDILKAIYFFNFSEPIGLNEQKEEKILNPSESVKDFLREIECRWMRAGWAVALNAYIENRIEKQFDLSKADNQEITKRELLDFMMYADEKKILKQGISPEQATNSIYIFGRGLLFQWALGYGVYDLAKESEPYWNIFLPTLFT